MKPLKLTGIIVCSLLTTSTFAQNWRLGGNTVFPFGGINSVNATNNSIGTDAAANFPINFITNGIQRQIIQNGGIGNNEGRIAMGNNLPIGFTPASRLHLHQNGGQNRIQFTNNGTGIGGGSGFQVGINNAGEALINQRENLPILIGVNSIERSRFNQDGNLELRTPTTEPYPTLVNYDADAKADVFGAIRSSHISGSSVSGTDGAAGTILYGATNMIGAPTNDGYRIRWDNHFFTNFNDALIFEKTDGQQSTPNGGHAGIVFANTGQNDTVVTAMVIKGNGRVGIGNVFGPNNKTSANSGTTIGAGTFRPWAHLDISETDSLAPQLRLTQTPHNIKQLGVHTDFQTTGIDNSLGEGNLLINPRYHDTLGYVAINLLDAATPLNTELALDVNGQQNLRYVEKDTNNLQYILVWDSINNGRIRYRNITDLGGGGTGGNIGNYCSDPQNLLIDNYEIPLNDFNYYFTGSGLPNTNSVSVGVPCSTFLPAKFVSYQNAGTTVGVTTIAGGFLNEDVANISLLTHYGVYGEASGDQTVGEIINVGGHFVAESATWRNIGVRGVARPGTHPNAANYAGFFITNTPSDWLNCGIQSVANNGDLNFGIIASAPATGSNRAGYFVGIAESTSGGILSSDQMFKTDVENIKDAVSILKKLKPHTYKMNTTGFPQFNFSDKKQFGFIAQEIGEVLPDLVHDSYMPSELDSLGNEISPAVSYKSLNYNALIPITVQAVNEITDKIDKSTLSDQNVKTNVQDLSNSLDKIKQMRGVTYEWSGMAQTNLNLDSLQHIGFIAQEIESIEPLLTFVDDSNLVHVNYDRVVPILVESVKELDAIVQTKDSIIDNLQTQIIEIRNCLNNANICYGEGNRTSSQNPSNDVNEKSIQLVNISSIILDQNLPNPFAENTVITYSIPDDVMEAKLMFYNMNGRIIKEMVIEERGESKLTVYGENLESGIYTYSLIADGKLIATKKMVKQ
ncbi:MAG: tail fiber domain-containing protein [Flavobacteriales bacterium]|nr:tail fiber domain-containing protein [Flavobacteriales bacterium]